MPVLPLYTGIYSNKSGLGSYVGTLLLGKYFSYSEIMRLTTIAAKISDI